jgi:hypothetical protein
VFFEPKGGGEASIEFTRAQLVTPLADTIDAEWRAGKIELESSGGVPWWAWVLVGVAGVAVLAAAGGAVAALLLRRSRVPSGFTSS